MKKKGIVIGKEFKELDGRVFVDHAAREAKLDISTRLKRRRSNKVKISKVPRQKSG